MLHLHLVAKSTWKLVSVVCPVVECKVHQDRRTGEHAHPHNKHSVQPTKCPHDEGQVKVRSEEQKAEHFYDYFINFASE